jgi:hypothetical protein
VPAYLFKTLYRSEASTSDPIELEHVGQAWKQATRAAGEMLKDLDGSLEPYSEWRMDVSDEEGNALFSLRVIPQSYVPRKELKRQ